MDGSALRVERENAERSLFARDRDQRVPIDVDQIDTIVLRNAGAAPLNYSIYVPTDIAGFTVTAVPGVGTLAVGEKRTVKLTFSLHYTFKVWRHIKIVAEGINGAYYLPILLEGEPSSRLVSGWLCVCVLRAVVSRLLRRFLLCSQQIVFTRPGSGAH